MDSAKINDWVQIVGIFALVASLLFVGLQMRQAQNIAIAEQYQNRGISYRESVFASLENESWLRPAIAQVESQYESGNGNGAYRDWYEAFGAEYVVEQVMLFRASLAILDSYYLGYQLGTMTEESWRPYQARLKRAFHSPQYRAVYSEDPDYYRESFRILCEELISEIERESD